MIDMTRYEGRTPGKWEMYEPPFGLVRITGEPDGDYDEGIMRDLTPRVCEVEDNDCEQANARLISDAPLLLAEVERLTRENAAATLIIEGHLHLAARLTRELAEARAEVEHHKRFGDLWYFVMDEKPMQFESIVCGHSPKVWMDEAFKLYALAHPKPAKPDEGKQT